MIWSLIALVSLLFTPPSAALSQTVGVEASESATVEPHRAAQDLGVEWGGHSVPFGVMAVFALPGETVPLEVRSSDSSFHARADAGTLESIGPNRWTWTAPAEPGHVPVRVTNAAGEEVLLNVFVLVPYERMTRGTLFGQHIGDYPAGKASSTAYARPRGFTLVTAATESVEVAPHFRLGQFVCKDQASYPKLVVLQPALLVKLERLIATAHEHGFDASTFHVMSAYRTPRYNKGIGNVTTFSRHQYGDAADIYLDEFPADGVMDDLNRDGRRTRADAQVLREWADAIDRDPSASLTGGLSAYGSTDSHGPFVHVDTRGFAARW